MKQVPCDVREVTLFETDSGNLELGLQEGDFTFLSPGEAIQLADALYDWAGV